MGRDAMDDTPRGRGDSAERGRPPLSPRGALIVGGLVRLGARRSGRRGIHRQAGCLPCVGLLQPRTVLPVDSAVGGPGDPVDPRDLGGRLEPAPDGLGLPASRRLAVRDIGALGRPAESSSLSDGQPVIFSRDGTMDWRSGCGARTAIEAVGADEPGRAVRVAVRHRRLLERSAGSGRVVRHRRLDVATDRSPERRFHRPRHHPRREHEPLWLPARYHPGIDAVGAAGSAVRPGRGTGALDVPVALRVLHGPVAPRVEFPLSGGPRLASSHARRIPRRGDIGPPGSPPTLAFAATRPAWTAVSPTTKTIRSRREPSWVVRRSASGSARTC